MQHGFFVHMKDPLAQPKSRSKSAEAGTEVKEKPGTVPEIVPIWKARKVLIIPIYYV